MTHAKSADENDRAREGALPTDPFADAEPVRPDGKPPLRWRTYGEILAATTEKPREWLVPDLIPFGAVTQFVGIAKRGGKSTIVWAMVGCSESGRLFLGFVLVRTSAVILSEENDHDLADKIRAFGMDPQQGVVLSRGVLTGIPDWVELVREGTRLALERGHRILVIDTFAFWAALEGASENDAGTVVAALRPLQEAADKGLAVLLIHHTGKAKDREGGIAARGSSAIAGTVEATIEVRNEGGEAHPNRRVLHVESRTVGVRDVLVELVLSEGAPARFDLVGDAQKVAQAEVAAAILAFLNANPGKWFSRDAVIEGVGKRGGDVRGALPALVEKRRIARAGKGTKGNPFVYATVGTPQPPAPSPSEDAIEDSVPRCPHSGPGTGSGGAPQGAEDSVPAVPALSMRAGRGTESAARGKDGMGPARRDGAGDGIGADGTATPGAHDPTPATQPAPPVQGRLELNPVRWQEGKP